MPITAHLEGNTPNGTLCGAKPVDPFPVPVGQPAPPNIPEGRNPFVAPVVCSQCTQLYREQIPFLPPTPPTTERR